MTRTRVERQARLCSGVLTVLGLAFLIMPARAQNRDPDFAIDHVGISVGNLEESVEWYVEMLGFELAGPLNVDPDATMNIARIRKGDFSIELFEIDGAAPLPEYRRDPSADLRVHGLAHFAFQVDDALAFQAELEAKGVEVVMRASEEGRSNFFFVSDNSGNTFEFIQRR
jgi:methylmalonyl-CoA/ethylmalonyl-CoA epimerase